MITNEISNVMCFFYHEGRAVRQLIFWVAQKQVWDMGSSVWGFIWTVLPYGKFYQGSLIFLDI
jgi:hypothetical protein